MQIENFIILLSIIGLFSTLFYGLYRVTRFAFILNILILAILVYYISVKTDLNLVLLYLGCPLMLINTGLYVFLHKTDEPENGDSKYLVNFLTNKGKL